jgi:photosystem II stability/assembly factor-like uncharacterized protein
MPILDINLNNTQQHSRIFIQPGGPSPVNGKLYGGVDMGWIELEGVELNYKGDIKAQFVNDPRRIGGWQAVSKMSSAPSLPTAKLRFSEKKGGIPRALAGLICQLNGYEAIGNECKNPSDFLTGWSEYVMIYPQGEGTKVIAGNRATWEGTEMLREEIDVVWSRNPYPISQMLFGTQAAGTLTGIQVRDIAYGNLAICGNCGPSNDGTRFLYGLVDGAAAAKPLVVYSVDGGATWTQQAISAGANAEIPTAIDVIGNYLVVLSKIGGGATQSCYYYTDINQLTGVPNSANWTKITAGFINTAAHGANDIFVVSANEIYFPADSGYIYKCTDITQGVTVNNSGATVATNLTRMHGYGSTYVAVGATAGVIKTFNGANTWVATTTAPTVGNATAVSVNSPYTFWVGGDTGRIWYTLDGGETWTEKTFAGSGAGSIKDIRFATPEVGYFSHSTATPTARIFSTWDGGYSWTNVAPRVNGIATFNSATRLAVPDSAIDPIGANNLAIAGIAANGADGIVYLGKAGLV